MLRRGISMLNGRNITTEFIKQSIISLIGVLGHLGVKKLDMDYL